MADNAKLFESLGHHRIVVKAVEKRFNELEAFVKLGHTPKSCFKVSRMHVVLTLSIEVVCWGRNGKSPNEVAGHTAGLGAPLDAAPGLDITFRLLLSTEDKELFDKY